MLGLAPEGAVQGGQYQLFDAARLAEIRSAISVLTPVGSVRPCPVPSRFLRMLLIRAIDQEA